MKVAFLLAFAVTVLGLQAQDEVEFVVQKKQEIKALLYMYTDMYPTGMKKGSEYVNINQVADTFYYYYATINRDTSKMPLPYLAVNYFTSNDTVYAHIRYDSISELQPVFIKGKKMLSTPVSINSFFYAPFRKPIAPYTDDNLFMLDSDVSVQIGDTAYKCIRLAGAREVPSDRNYVRTKNGYKPKKNPDVYYNVSIYYLRQTDYLPIKTSFVEGYEKQFSTRSTFNDGGSNWKLYKVFK